MNRTRKKRKRRSSRPAASPESRAAEVLTVFWLLSVMAALMAELAALACRAYVLLAGSWIWIDQMSHLMLFIAIVTGALSLASTVGVLKLRREPPPRSVTIFAVVIGVIPLATILALALLR